MSNAKPSAATPQVSHWTAVSGGGASSTSTPGGRIGSLTRGHPTDRPQRRQATELAAARLTRDADAAARRVGAERDLPDRADRRQLGDVQLAVVELGVDRAREPADDSGRARLVALAGAGQLEEQQVLAGVTERAQHIVVGRVPPLEAEDESAVAVTAGERAGDVEQQPERRAVGGERADRSPRL